MPTILIVDDHALSRQALMTLLGYYPHRLLEASNGAEALDLARSEHPDLIITDIAMPTMDGYEFVHRLRADMTVPYCPVIFYTAVYHEREARSLARASGVSHLLFKPCDPEKILLIVGEVLEQPQVPVCQPPDREFSSMHKRVLTDKLARKVQQLEEEVVERKRVEEGLRESERALFRANERLLQQIEDRKRAEDELVKNQRQLQAMTLELALAEERERDRIAGELHDQVGQSLILAKLKLDALTSRLSTESLESDAEEIARLLGEAIQDLRTLTFQIRPPLLASAGLEAALQWLGEEMKEDFGLLINFIDDGKPKPLKYEVRSTVFQAVRELLLNVAKHAGADRVQVKMDREGDYLVIDIHDDGIGFDSCDTQRRTAKQGGFGLFNVRQRIECVGGSIVIASEVGNGTRATIKIPLDKSQDGQGEVGC